MSVRRPSIGVSETEMIFLVATARWKLMEECSRGEGSWDLRVLVGHANLLDSLNARLEESSLERERVGVGSTREGEEMMIERFVREKLEWSEAELAVLEEEEGYDEEEPVRVEEVKAEGESDTDSNSDDEDVYGVDDELCGSWDGVLVGSIESW
jgi:hypothetical protein